VSEIPYLKTKRGPISETLSIFRISRIKKSNNPENYTPSSESFRIYFGEPADMSLHFKVTAVKTKKITNRLRQNNER
jgi:hypothetical protein